jgi:hypothetical protein
MVGRQGTCSLIAWALVAVSVAIAQTRADVVQANDYPDEPSLIAFLNENALLKDQANVCGDAVDETVVGDLMKRGWFDSSVLLIDACVAAGRKVDGGVHQAASVLRKRISEVTHFLQTAQQGSQAISPAFEWAQSR